MTFLFHNNKKTAFPHLDFCPPCAAGDADGLKGSVLPACMFWEERRHAPLCELGIGFFVLIPVVNHGYFYIPRSVGR